MNTTGPAVAFGQSSNPAFGLAVPTGYMSGNILGDTTVVFGPTALLPNLTSQTIASLGLSPGETTWSWGSEPDQSFSICVAGGCQAPSEIPAPAALPLFGTGLGALGLLGWRRKRKSTTSVLAA
jgi:hypothetical protein